MKIRIEAVISTAGNDEAYVGHHLGLATIGRPLTSMAVVFIQEVTPEEYVKLKVAERGDMKELSNMFRFGPNALQIEQFKSAMVKATSNELGEVHMIETRMILEAGMKKQQ